MFVRFFNGFYQHISSFFMVRNLYHEIKYPMKESWNWPQPIKYLPVPLLLYCIRINFVRNNFYTCFLMTELRKGKDAHCIEPLRQWTNRNACINFPGEAWTPLRLNWNERPVGDTSPRFWCPQCSQSFHKLYIRPTNFWLKRLTTYGTYIPDCKHYCLHGCVVCLMVALYVWQHVKKLGLNYLSMQGVDIRRRAAGLAR